MIHVMTEFMALEDAEQHVFDDEGPIQFLLKKAHRSIRLPEARWYAGLSEAGRVYVISRLQQK